MYTHQRVPKKCTHFLRDVIYVKCIYIFWHPLYTQNKLQILQYPVKLLYSKIEKRRNLESTSIGFVLNRILPSNYSSEHSLPSKSNSFTTNQEFPPFFFKHEGSCRVYNSPQTVPKLNQINTAHPTFYFLNIHFNIISISTLWSSELSLPPPISCRHYTSTHACHVP